MFGRKRIEKLEQRIAQLEFVLEKIGANTVYYQQGVADYAVSLEDLCRDFRARNCYAPGSWRPKDL